MDLEHVAIIRKCMCPCMPCVSLQGIKLYWHVLEAMLKAEEARAGLPAAGKCHFAETDLRPSTGLSALVQARCVMAPGLLSYVFLLRSSYQALVACLIGAYRV